MSQTVRIEKKKIQRNYHWSKNEEKKSSLTSFRLNESKLLSEQTDDASLSSDSSREIFRFKCSRLISEDKSPSSGD